MIVEYIRYQISADRAEEFLRAYARAAPVLEADPRCLGYDLARGVEEPDRFVVRIEWTSVDDHLQGFRRSPGFATFFAAVKPFFSDIEEMAHYDRRQEYRPSRSEETTR
jgi:quinol monooxygenase YgiN